MIVYDVLQHLMGESQNIMGIADQVDFKVLTDKLKKIPLANINPLNKEDEGNGLKIHERSYFLEKLPTSALGVWNAKISLKTTEMCRIQLASGSLIPPTSKFETNQKNRIFHTGGRGSKSGMSWASTAFIEFCAK